MQILCPIPLKIDVDFGVLPLTCLRESPHFDLVQAGATSLRLNSPATKGDIKPPKRE